MCKNRAEELVTFIQQEAGTLVRSVAYFDEDKRELLYVRGDIEDLYSKNEIQTVFNDLSFDSLGKEHTEQMYVHGELNCIVRHFAEAIELHFPHGEKSGTAIALDPNAIKDLGSIIQCFLSELSEDHSSSV
ncbi:DUF7522 family protein [Natronorubrum sp. FCH18a]|uniref:DUF7522 family protein n=1 Tax=Natronorubrum sp. FCH18a TaxID=3447018 RepID=UPI003F51AB8D